MLSSSREVGGTETRTASSRCSSAQPDYIEKHWLFFPKKTKISESRIENNIINYTSYF